jgi:hypothetical protein
VETVRKFLSVIARVIAAIFAFLFVITNLLAILLTTLNGQMFNSRLYKNAMVELNIYGRLPEIVGTAITTSFMIGPCDQNQLTCSINGTSSELQICLKTALGTATYQAIGSGSRSPTSAELHLAQPCLEHMAPGRQPTHNQGIVGAVCHYLCRTSLRQTGKPSFRLFFLPIT